jgi:hypothetical protein
VAAALRLKRTSPTQRGTLATTREADSDLVARISTSLSAWAIAATSRSGGIGARIGSAPGETEVFRDDMLRFWRRVMAQISV